MLLRDEILTGPLAATLAPFVASGSDNEIAAALNKPRYEVAADVSRIDLLMWAAQYDILGPLRDAAAERGSPVRSIADAALLIFTVADLTSVNMADPGIAELFTALTQAGIIKAEAVDAIAGRRRIISRAEQAFGANVSDADVARALRG